MRIPGHVPDRQLDLQLRRFLPQPLKLRRRLGNLVLLLFFALPIPHIHHSTFKSSPVPINYTYIIIVRQGKFAAVWRRTLSALAFMLMSKSPSQPGEALARIHGALADLLRTAPQSAVVVAEILDLLEEIDRDRQRVRLARTPSGQRDLRPRRGDAVEGYEIQDTPRGQVLIERRYHTPNDFRCPKDVYDAAAQVMEGQAEPMGFDQILSATAEQLGYTPADYLCRICLRFWLAQNQPLVLRARAKYQPTSPRRFVQQAQQAWKKLAEQSRK